MIKDEKESMDNVNDMALTKLVEETIEIGSSFDYSDVSQDDEKKLIKIKLRKRLIVEWTILEIGGDLVDAQDIYSHYGNGKFKAWVEEEYDMRFSTARKYIQAYKVLSERKSDNLLYNDDNIETLGVHKLSSLYKLGSEQRKDIITNAPLHDMTVQQVDELTKKVKEAEEYSDELVEEIRKKDKKIRENRDSVEQKDKEIQELKSKIQELESGNMQPVAEIQEKIVEKEVIPDSVKQELAELKEKNERLEQETREKVDIIKEQTQEIINSQKALQDLKADSKEIRTDLDDTIDIGVLFTRIKTFLDTTSSYILLDSQYQELSDKNRVTLMNAVKSVREWCNSMEKAINSISTDYIIKE